MTASIETVRLTQRQDYQFDVHFSDVLPALQADEPPALGQGLGPSPVPIAP